ncbi:MAG TPA: biotin transporter BioY [Nocardioides sp.]|uniref:biotin transporter BioY n=1 Tax=Nocardioides sp. TaxID=35761 RepID=UPI002DA6F7D1|nr:biotin transporter BioY [Nocardioides sp.]
MSSTALVPTLVRPSNRAAALVADAVLVALGVGLIAASAQFSIHLPHTPVPITGQTFAVLLVGGAYGATRGFVTMAAYLAVGGLGYGVFAGHASGWDLLKLSSATGGYLVGMLVAAGLVGWLADRGWDRKATRSLPTMVLGNIVIYAVGATWLAHALGVGAQGAWDYGVKDFLVGDAIKILLAAGLLPAAWKLVDAVRR